MHCRQQLPDMNLTSVFVNTTIVVNSPAVTIPSVHRVILVLMMLMTTILVVSSQEGLLERLRQLR
jgi:hypothetical protein